MDRGQARSELAKASHEKNISDRRIRIKNINKQEHDSLFGIPDLLSIQSSMLYSGVHLSVLFSILYPVIHRFYAA